MGNYWDTILNFLLIVSVIDAIGVSDHVVAESGGEESEDEWNYVKVDTEKKEETIESHAVAQAIAESQEACIDVSSFLLIFQKKKKYRSYYQW